ncbi:MAG: hypothetical protein NVSMB57_05930 [Actinomycetota bacterium]
MSSLRTSLLAKEEQAWHELNALCARISDEAWHTPGVSGHWTARDVVAHIACWAAEACRQLECIRASAPSRNPDVETFNAESHAACKDLSVNEVLAMAEAAHQRLREELELVAPVALNAKVIDMLHECSDRHYREHGEQLRALIEGSQ